MVFGLRACRPPDGPGGLAGSDIHNFYYGVDPDKAIADCTRVLALNHGWHRSSVVSIAGQLPGAIAGAQAPC